jgi:hypothetical protein
MYYKLCDPRIFVLDNEQAVLAQRQILLKRMGKLTPIMPRLPSRVFNAPQTDREL